MRQQIGESTLRVQRRHQALTRFHSRERLSLWRRGCLRAAYATGVLGLDDELTDCLVIHIVGFQNNKQVYEGDALTPVENLYGFCMGNPFCEYLYKPSLDHLENIVAALIHSVAHKLFLSSSGDHTPLLWVIDEIYDGFRITSGGCV